MKLTISNKIRVERATPELSEYLKALLTLVNPSWVIAKKFKRSTKGLKKHIIQYTERNGCLYLPRGILEHILEDLGCEAEIDDQTVAPPAPPWPTPKAILRSKDQEVAVSTLLRYNNGFLSAPPGSGKTVMGLETCRRRGLQALWLTHSTGLKDQVIEEAIDLFNLSREEIGVLHGSSWTVGDRLTVGMIPTLRRRDLSGLRDTFGLIIVDEAHHIPCQSFLHVLSQFTSRYLYGFTATAYRNDGLENLMFNGVGPIKAQIDQADLFEDEQLMKPQVVLRRTGWLPPNADDLEYHDFMSLMVDDPRRNSLIVEDIKREATGKNTIIVLVDRTKHAEILTNLVKEAGLNCEFLTGSIDVPKKKRRKTNLKKIFPKGARKKILNEFKSGEIQVLVATYDLLAEGFNYRPLNRLFLASPVRYRGTVTQALGRVQRTCVGKKDAIVYDYIDDLIPMFLRQFESRLEGVYRAKELPVCYRD